MRRSELRQLPSRVVPSTEGLLDLCDAHGARGTFFVLGVVAQRYPRLVRTIVEQGHEIASHGWDHTLVDALGPARFREDVRRSKRTLEQASGQAVWGYRAPNYSIRRDTPWAFPTLWEEGYAYDSSIHPIAHDRYGFPDAPRFPHVAITVDGGDFWEVPVGTARAAGTNLPIGGGFFRLFPRSLLRGAVRSINRRDRRRRSPRAEPRVRAHGRARGGDDTGRHARAAPVGLGTLHVDPRGVGGTVAELSEPSARRRRGPRACGRARGGA